MEQMPVPAADEGSWEHVLHEVLGSDALLPLANLQRTASLRERRGHRAIGVVYHPDYERYGNYVPTLLPERYDAFVFLDETTALHPLPVPVRVDAEEPETYPAGT
jgi:erythromycin esterase-like protein